LKLNKIPFVGLHAHDGFSVGDGLGYPDEHFDFAYSNGLDAHAITNHGNMNSLPHMVLHHDKMKAEGKEFKVIYGMEAYFVPSIDSWHVKYNEIQEKKKLKKRKKADISATVVEDEDETRKAKSALNQRRHLLLLAQNQKGLNNLFKIVSLSYQRENFYRYPRVDYKMLEQYGEGIIATSACLGGVYAGSYWENREEGADAVLSAMRETTKKMLSIFGDRWYAEVQWNAIPEQHALNHFVIQIAKEFDLQLISTVDSHYPHPDAWRDRELYKRLAWLGKKKPSWLQKEIPESVDEIGYELYPKNGNEVWDSYIKYSKQLDQEYNDDLILGSIKRTHWIAHNRIEDFRPDTTVRLPSFVIPEGMHADEALATAAVVGLKSRNLHKSKEYVERLRKELYVIASRGFSKYFLTMKAISDKAQELSLVGPGRGSAAGALTSYVLGITQVDPLKYGLLFERFLTKHGSGYPDIDYDVANPMRLKEALIEEWGKNVVVPISNFNTLKLRSLIKDISKYYDIPFKEVNNVTSKMIDEAKPLAKASHGITAGMYVPTFEEVMKYSSSLQHFLGKYPHVKKHVEAIHGQIRSVSRHAGGVVVGEDLDKHMPLINSGGVSQTPWTEGQNARHLEPMGFIKFDLLGLSTIEMIEQCVKSILARHYGVQDASIEQVRKYYDRFLHPDAIDLQDKKVWKNIFHDGKFAGIFQFTQKGAQSFCIKAKPDNIIDLAAITSIYRPGPLSAKVDRGYVAAKENPADVEYKHPIIKEHSQDTHGFLIFQEQIAMLVHKFGKNISLDEGNKLRKLLTKRGSEEVERKKEEIHKKFIEGCLEKRFDKDRAEKLWQTFEYFSGYGFNKSHAVSYCLISYQCAWLLNYYQAEWLAAFLDREPETRKEHAIATAKSLGYKIETVNINTSGTSWTVGVDNKTLIQPLTSIKGLGEKAVDQIMANRPFSSVENLLFNENIVYSKLNKRSLDALVRSGALNCLKDSRFSGLKHFWAAIAVDRPKDEKKLLENIELYRPEGDFTEEEKLNFLISLTGIFPLYKVVSKQLLKRFEEEMIPPISEYDPDLAMAWFVVRSLTEKKTKKGRDYWVLEVTDSSNQIIKVRCWAIKKGRDVVHLNRPYKGELSYNDNWGFSTRSVYHNFTLLS
jgi:DNA polymerase-3 subunit alpha